jgi:uncharacterized protein (DUF302 family)
MSSYGYTTEVPEGYDEAVLRSRLAFKSEGFSILSEMHVGGMLGPEAGDERQYLIMGVWNASVSDKQIGSDIKVAVHLPCNIVIQETGDSAVVAALDPVDALEPSEPHTIEATEHVRAALERFLTKVGEGA